ASRHGNTDVSCDHCIAKNTYVFGNVVMGLNRNSIHRSSAQAVIEEIIIESDVAFSLKQCLPHTILVEKISIDQIVVICSIPTYRPVSYQDVGSRIRAFGGVRGFAKNVIANNGHATGRLSQTCIAHELVFDLHVVANGISDQVSLDDSVDKLLCAIGVA